MKKKNNKIFVLDTEDDTKGNVYLIIFYDKINFYIYKNKQDALNFLNEIRKKYNRIKIFSHNALYDIMNIFENLENLKIIFFGKSKKFIYAQYYNIYFIDSLNIFNTSIKELGKIINFEKIKTKNYNDIEYCKRDCEILFKSLEYLTKELKLKNMYKIKTTISAISFEIFNKHFLFRKLYPIKNEEDLNNFKKFYFGGRTEILCEKNKEYKNIYHFDINSLYPFVMKEHLFIYNNNNYFFEKNIDNETFEKIHNQKNFYVINCDIETKINFIPFRTDYENIDFLKKSDNAYLTKFDIEFLKKYNIQYKINYIYYIYIFYDFCNYFKNFIDYFYDKRIKANNNIEKLIYKLIMNSLYGKFATGNINYVITKYNKELENKLLEKGIEYSIYNFLNEKIIEYKILKKNIYYVNYIIASQITDLARLKTFEIQFDIEKNFKSKVLYIDTDSFFIDFYNDEMKKKFFEKYVKNEIGYLKLENIFKKIIFYNKKIYYGINKNNQEVIRCAGIPSEYAKDFILNKRIQFKKPVKFLEAVKRKLRPNIWIEVEKILYDT